MPRSPLVPNRRSQTNPEGIARTLRGLDRLVADPLAWRWRDGAYQDYVGAQFSRAYGPGPAARDETGKPLPADPIRMDIEPYRPQARPEDPMPAQPVGPDRPNRPGDVLGLQKVLSAVGRYVFDIAGGERAGVFSDTLRAAIEGFQGEAGAAVDGAVAPGGETAPLLRRALWPEGGPMTFRAEQPRPGKPAELKFRDTLLRPDERDGPPPAPLPLPKVGEDRWSNILPLSTETTLQAGPRPPIAGVHLSENKPERPADPVSPTPQRIAQSAPRPAGSLLSPMPEDLTEPEAQKAILGFMAQSSEAMLAAEAAIDRTSPIEAKTVDEGLRRQMLRAFASSSALRDKHPEVLAAVLTATEDDPTFLADDAGRTDQLVEALLGDSTVKRVVTDWPNMNREEREASFVDMVETVSAIYGIQDPPKVVFVELPEGINARHVGKGNRIEVNPNSEHFERGGSFGGDILGTAVEEVMHAYERRLAWERMNGTLSSSDPRYRQAELFALNLFTRPDFGRTTKGRYYYESQPMERHAKSVRARVREAIKVAKR